MKLSAASPQWRLSHSIFASYPPAATTTARAANHLRRSIRLQRHGFEAVIFDDQILDEGIVANADSHALRGAIVGVQQRLAAAEKPAIGAPQAERARERLLPGGAVLGHPLRQLARLANREFREIEIRGPAGDADQILQKLFFAIGAEKNSSAAACAQRILRVCREFPPRMCSGRALEQQDARHDVPRRHGRGQAPRCLRPQQSRQTGPLDLTHCSLTDDFTAISSYASVRPFVSGPKAAEDHRHQQPHGRHVHEHAFVAVMIEQEGDDQRAEHVGQPADSVTQAPSRSCGYAWDNTPAYRHRAAARKFG